MSSRLKANVLIGLLTGLYHCFPASAAESPFADLGTPPSRCSCCSEIVHAGRPASYSSATATNGQVSNFSVDTSDRMAVLDLYHCVYDASEGFMARMNWVGDVGSCNEGTVSDDFHDDTLRRINYYRAMAGLNSDITFSATKNAACQEAALMMSANGALSHAPPPSWSCWSLAGSNAASHGNLALSGGDGYTGPAAVDGMIYDPGPDNIPVGHRRWLLYSRAYEMGNGGVPRDGSYGSSATIWVVGDFVSPSSSPPWIAWPNAGYVPYPLVPERWSLSMAGANFGSASVSMTVGNLTLPLTIVHPTLSSPAANIGDSTIVWEPDGMPIPSLSTDEVYTVTVTGIADAALTEVSYTTTVINPGSVGLDTAISGATTPLATRTNTYTFIPVPGAQSYNVRIRTLDGTAWTEGAEDSPDPMLIDGTSLDYDLIQSAVTRSGSKGFQMAFPDFVDQWVEIDRTLLPSDDSELSFYYRRRFSSTVNVLAAEISGNDGLSWQAPWSVNGICSGSCSSSMWDPSWIQATVDLSPWSGQTVRIRFSLTHNSLIYTGYTSSYGFFLDDITVSNSRQLTGSTVTSIPAAANTYALVPDATGSYLLDVGVEGPCYSYGYGTGLMVTSMPAIYITGMAASNGFHLVDFIATGGVCDVYSVSSATNPSGPWVQDTGATFNGSAGRFTISPDEASSPPFYRISGENL